MDNEFLAKNLNESPEHLGTPTLDGRLGYIGPYQLLNRLGNGGMAVVYKACSIHPEREHELVAIKILNDTAAADPAKAEYFRDEAYLLSTLGHANLVRTLEAGIHQGQYYLVMQYIDGCDLGSLLDNLTSRNLILPPQVGVYIINNLLAALKYIHQAHATDGKPLGLVHRDICPANVLLSNNGQVLLSDFGIATHILPRHLHRQLNAGHLGYLAPEQITNKAVDQRTDLFAAGVLLYEVITNVQPFYRPQRDDSYWATLEHKPLPAPHIDVELRKKLIPLFKKACHPNPDKRFQTAEQFQDALLTTFGECNSGTALTALMSTLYPSKKASSAFFNGPADDTETLSNAINWTQVYNLTNKPIDNIVRLLLKAGYRSRIIPGNYRPDPNHQVVIIAENCSFEQINTIISHHKSLALVLLGSIDDNTLQIATQLGHNHCLFAPYNAERINFLLSPTTPVKARSRFNTLEYIPHMSLFQQIKLLYRRVLLIGWSAADAATCCMELEQWRISCHAVGTIAEALSLSDQHSFNLVLLSPQLAEHPLGAISDLRDQYGYGLLPVLLPRAADNHLERRISDAIYCENSPNDMSTLSKRILSILLNNNQRSFMRYSTSLEAIYSYLGVVQEGTLVNIGRLGGLLLTKQIIPIGALIHIKVTINKDEAKYVDIDKAQVVHIALEEDRLGGNVLIGCNFGGMSEANEMDWLHFIYEQDGKLI